MRGFEGLVKWDGARKCLSKIDRLCGRKQRFAAKRRDIVVLDQSWADSIRTLSEVKDAEKEVGQWLGNPTNQLSTIKFCDL
jgi:hypothetical protein